MNKKINSWLLLAVLAVFAVSCSQSDELLPADEQLSETRANSPLLIVSPTEVYFNNVAIFTSSTETVNVKDAGISSLAVLTRFDVAIQGADDGHFSVNPISLSLTEILQAILGQGVNIPVKYLPFTEGPHEAELLITASLLGVLMPAQITVPLHGTTVRNTLTLVNTVPVDGGTVEYDGQVPNEEEDPMVQYHLDFIFDKNISIGSGFTAQFLDGTTAEIVRKEVINNNILRVTINDFYRLAGLQHKLTISRGSISDMNGYPYGYDINLTYSGTGELPSNYIDED